MRANRLTYAATRRLRTSRATSLLALLAMLAQALFAGEHASAMAAAAARGGSNGDTLGFLEICTARGLLRIPAPAENSLDRNNSAPLRSSSGDAGCVLCGTASITGAPGLGQAPSIIQPVFFLQAVLNAPASPQHVQPGFKRAGTTRGPPLACLLRMI